MKPIKSYFFKIAVFLIVLGSMAILYWYWSYKKFDKKCIPQNTDGIVTVDVKNIRNYFILSYLKNPAQWKTTETEKKFDLSEFGIETPDYLAFFHLENQPITQWFAVAKIENEIDFDKAMSKENLIIKILKNGMSSYYSKYLSICIIKHSNQILFAIVPEKQIESAVKIAEDLFLKKLFLDAKKIKETIGTTNAATVWIKKNSLLEEDGIVTINLENQEIVAEGQLQLKSKYKKELQFYQNPNSLLSFGFNFEMIQNQNIIKDHLNQINKIIGFNLDSILVHHPTKTELLLNEIVEKKDSAISYGYDDDFNPIKKIVVNTSSEPSFYFSIQTDDSQKVYNYLKTQNAIDNHQVFVNFPLAKTKALVKNNTLVLETNLTKQWTLKPSISKIAYLQINFKKLQTKYWRFIIAKNKNFQLLEPFETLTIDITKENKLSHFEARLKTNQKKNLIEILK